jgi:hypothetical protein
MVCRKQRNRCKKTENALAIAADTLYNTTINEKQPTGAAKSSGETE